MDQDGDAWPFSSAPVSADKVVGLGCAVPVYL